MSQYFKIDTSRPIPRGPEISYQCLKCGDVIPSVEGPGAPWNCRCNSVSVDHAAFKTWFEHPELARGVRDDSPRA